MYDLTSSILWLEMQSVEERSKQFLETHLKDLLYGTKLTKTSDCCCSKHVSVGFASIKSYFEWVLPKAPTWKYFERAFATYMWSSLLRSSTLFYFILVFTSMLYRIASASSFNSFTLVNTLTLVWSTSSVSGSATCRVVVFRFASPCYCKLHESLNLEMADCEESLMCKANIASTYKLKHKQWISISRLTSRPELKEVR